MNTPATLLSASRGGNVLGAVAGLVFIRREKLANILLFGTAALSALAGLRVFRIRETFASMDVSKLNELKW